MTQDQQRPVPYNCPSKNTRSNIGRAKRCSICGLRHKKGPCPKRPNYQ